MRRSRIALVIAVVALLVAAQRMGLFAEFADIERARHTLLGIGPWGYAAFILAYASLQPFGVPGTVFIMVAPLIWPWPVAFALSMAGTMAASVVGFSFARFVAREEVAKRIPARFRAYDAWLARNALSAVFTLRLIFWMPPLLHAFFGVSRVPFWTHFWGSAAGYVIPLFLTSFFGRALFDWARNAPPSTWALVAAVMLTVGLSAWALNRRFGRRCEVTPDAP